MRHTDRIELLLETLHTDHIHLLVLGEIEDLGEVQRRGEARVEKFVLSTFMDKQRTIQCSSEDPQRHPNVTLD